MNTQISAEALLAKLNALPADRLGQVAEFVDFLAAQDRRRQAGEALREMWARMQNEEITEEIEQEIDEAVRTVRSARRSRGAT